MKNELLKYAVHCSACLLTFLLELKPFLHQICFDEKICTVRLVKWWLVTAEVGPKAKQPRAK
jgi:hypothetical protein